MFKSSFYIYILTLCSPINILAMEPKIEGLDTTCRRLKENFSFSDDGDDLEFVNSELQKVFDASDYSEFLLSNSIQGEASNDMDPNLPGLNEFNGDLQAAFEASDYSAFLLSNSVQLEDSNGMELPGLDTINRELREALAGSDSELDNYEDSYQTFGFVTHLLRQTETKDNSEYEKPDISLAVAAQTEENHNAYQSESNQNENPNPRRISQSTRSMTRSPGNNPMQVMPRPQNNQRIINVAPQQNQNANRGMQPQQFQNGNGGMQPQQFQNANRGMQPQQFQNGNRGMQPQQFPNANRGMQPQQFQNTNRGMQPQQFQNGNRGMQPQQIQNGNRGMQPQQIQNRNRGMQPQQIQNGNRGMQPQQIQNGNRGMQLQKIQNGNRGMQPQQFQNGNRGMQPQQNQTRGYALKPITSPNPNSGVMAHQQDQMINADLEQNPNLNKEDTAQQSQHPEEYENLNKLDSFSFLDSVFDQEDAEKAKIDKRIEVKVPKRKLFDVLLDRDEDTNARKIDIINIEANVRKKDIARDNASLRANTDKYYWIKDMLEDGKLPQKISSSTYPKLKIADTFNDFAMYLLEIKNKSTVQTIYIILFDCHGKMKPWGQVLLNNCISKEKDMWGGVLLESWHLKTLRFEEASLTDEDVEILCAHLNETNTLKELSLKKNPVTDRTGFFLAHQLTKSHALKRLNLDETQISVLGIAPFCCVERELEIEVSVMGCRKNMNEDEFNALKNHINICYRANPKVFIKIEDKFDSNSPYSSNGHPGLKPSKSANTEKKDLKKNDSPIKVEIKEPTQVEFEKEDSTPKDKRKSDTPRKRKSRVLSQKK